jgi:hypothetical protein
MEKQIEIPGKRKKEKAKAAQPGRAPASPNRWVPPVSGGSLPRALSLPLSLPSGAGLLAPVAFPHAPTLSLVALWDRPVSSAFPAPAVDQHARTRARTPRSRATSPAHAPQLLFEHRPCPHSLPHPISHSLAPSRALLALLGLAGDPRPSCHSSSPSEAALGHPELRPEVRHPSVPLALLKLVQALARLRPPPHGWNSSSELTRPARSPPSSILPSLTLVSWPQPNQ